MTKKTIALQAKKRTEKGKAFARRMRRSSGFVPGVVYGAGKESQMIALNHNVVLKYLGQESFHTQIIDLDIEGEKGPVVLKEAQFYPGKPKVLHLDFQRVSAKEKLTMKIPLHFIGEDLAPGVKEEGGAISHNLSEVEVRCLPADLPEAIDVDVSGMKLNQVLHLTDLTLPSGVELVALAQGVEDHDLSVASIHIAHVEKEEPAAETEGDAVSGDDKDKESTEAAGESEETDASK